MREAVKAQAARARAANAAMMAQEVPEWAKSREPEEVEESEEEELDEVEFECVACKKIFKSERQFEAHEKSKKHQKAVQALRRKMHKENQNFQLDEDHKDSGMTTPSPEDGEPQDNHQSWSDADDVAEAARKLDLENNQADQLSDSISKEAEDAEPVDRNGEIDLSIESSSDGGDSDYAPGSEVDSRLQDPRHVDIDGIEARPAPAEKKMGKAAQKRAKKAAQKTSPEETDFTHKCAHCNAAFPSRRRLFQHINDFGHATSVPKSAKGKGKR